MWTVDAKMLSTLAYLTPLQHMFVLCHLSHLYVAFDKNICYIKINVNVVLYRNSCNNSETRVVDITASSHNLTPYLIHH